MFALRLLAPVLVLLVACAPDVAGPVQPAAGAPAAPDAAIVDTSTTAVAQYRTWLDYELNADSDRLRDFEAVAYPDGIHVCAQRAIGTDIAVIERTLSGTKGWTGTGAAAVIRAALVALCPRYDNGYRTFFDRNVDAASTLLAAQVHWANGPPVFYETGYFLKEACGYLATNRSAEGLEAHLHSFRIGGPGQSAPAAGFVQRVPDDRTLRRATHLVVLSGCPGDHLALNGYWTLA